MKNITDAAGLIKEAAELGIVTMPDENTVWVAWEFEDGSEGWRKMSLLSAAIDLAKNKSAVEQLAQEIQTRKVEGVKKKPEELLAQYLAYNLHACPLKDSVSVPTCECWGSDMCAKCILEHAEELAHMPKENKQ